MQLQDVADALERARRDHPLVHQRHRLGAPGPQRVHDGLQVLLVHHEDVGLRVLAPRGVGGRVVEPHGHPGPGDGHDPALDQVRRAGLAHGRAGVLAPRSGRRRPRAGRRPPWPAVPPGRSRPGPARAGPAGGARRRRAANLALAAKSAPDRARTSATDSVPRATTRRARCGWSVTNGSSGGTPDDGRVGQCWEDGQSTGGHYARSRSDESVTMRAPSQHDRPPFDHDVTRVVPRGPRAASPQDRSTGRA